MRFFQSLQGVFVWLTRFAALFFCAVCLTACGVVSDSFKESEVRLQEDPGILFSAQFYQQASPAEVRQAINGQSLAKAVAEVKYTTRSYSPQGIDLYPLSSGSILLTNTITPLSVALENTPHAEVIRILLDAGSFIATRNTSLAWELMMFFAKHPSKASLDLAFPTAPKDRCVWIRSLIRYAYPAHPTATLSLFLQKFPDTDFSCQQSMPLQAAVNGDKQEIVLWMIQQGVNINVVFEDGKTPLQLAAERRYWALANRLVHHGADKSVLTETQRRNLAAYGMTVFN